LDNIDLEGHSSAPSGVPKPRVAVIVAHPDDETLWAGGTMLARPEWDWFVMTLCRASDTDRAPKFFRALRRLGAAGTMGDLDDGPEQIPLAKEALRNTILSLLPDTTFDRVVTHGAHGEYTRHRRHEEAFEAVSDLWEAGLVRTPELWAFAYEDGGGAYLPWAIPEADKVEHLPHDLWQVKYGIVTDIYGFDPGSFEATVTPQVEAFWCFHSPAELRRRLADGRNR
jgi:LmbE family N-acetylglucosaminyl deacetylase